MITVVILVVPQIYLMPFVAFASGKLARQVQLAISEIQVQLACGPTPSLLSCGVSMDINLCICIDAKAGQLQLASYYNFLQLWKDVLHANGLKDCHTWRPTSLVTASQVSVIYALQTGDHWLTPTWTVLCRGPGGVHYPISEDVIESNWFGMMLGLYQ